MYVIDNPDPNDNFTVSVSPINAVGPGESIEMQGKLNYYKTSLQTNLGSTKLTKM